MTDTETLYDTIETAQIHLEHFPLQTTPSLCIDAGGDYYIALDPAVQHNEALHRVVLAHETGHCMTGAFYNQYSTLDLVGKQEQKADRWAVTTLLPWADLSDYLAHNDREVWEIAEAFGVTAEFVCRALEIYRQDGLYTEPVAP